MSRNSHSNENDKVYETKEFFSSNRVNIHGFDDLANFRQICDSEISLAELMILTILTNFSKFVEAKSAGRI